MDERAVRERGAVKPGRATVETVTVLRSSLCTSAVGACES